MAKLFYSRTSDIEAYNNNYIWGPIGTNWFNGMKVGDYTFIKPEGKDVEVLAKITNISEANETGKGRVIKAKFDRKAEFAPMKVIKLVALNLFEMNMVLLNYIVKPHRGVVSQELKLVDNKDMDIFKDRNKFLRYIDNDDNYRKILVCDNLASVDINSKNVQLYEENGKLCLYPAKFISKEDVINRFNGENYTYFVNEGLSPGGSAGPFFRSLKSGKKEITYDRGSLIGFYDLLVGNTKAKSKKSSKKKGKAESEKEKKAGKKSGVVPIYKNLILYGPPGTGKTYSLKDKIIETIKGCTEAEAKDALNNTGKYKDRVKFVTFHQSYGYEDFIEGIKPIIVDSSTGDEITPPYSAGVKPELIYRVENGVFKRFCNDAKDKEEPYVFIIDEINRGNISKIFGELITLVEEDKRLGGSNPMQVVLPYSKESFGIPSNIYIIGTMNTADRSLALMDTALRRRFEFEEMMPEPTTLLDDCEGVNLRELLTKINKRIEYLYDREHTIGHAYLIGVDNIDKLNSAFQNKIIPLLQEYFYNDYEKIMMVLNQNDGDDIFIKKYATEEISELFKTGNSDYFEDKIRYEVVKEIDATVDQYKAIYE